MASPSHLYIRPFTTTLLLLTALLAGGCTPDYPPSPATTYLKNGHPYCTLHDVPIQPGWADIEYGLIHISRQDHNHMMMTFPNAELTTMGGCTIESSSPYSERVWCCLACRKAQLAWDQAHQGSKSNYPHVPEDFDSIAPEEILKLILRQTDADEINVGLEALAYRLRGETDEAAAQRLADAYIQIGQRLGRGWPEYKGWIIGLNQDKTPQFSTSQALLNKCPFLLTLLWSSWKNQQLSRVYSALEPRQDSRWYESWLYDSIIRSSFPDTRDPRMPPPSVSGMSSGHPYSEEWWVIGPHLTRVITCKGRLGHPIFTVLADPARYPAPALIDAELAGDPLLRSSTPQAEPQN